MKKEQIKVMISKVKNKIWLFLKKIYAKLPEKMKVHIRKLKPKEKIKGEYRGSDRAERDAGFKGISKQELDPVILGFVSDQHYTGNL